MIQRLFIVVLAVASYTYASKMCGDDDDCADLGDVFCMKSRCDWGICGCPRGQAMRFLGSEKLFQCVPIRRVGESCSTDDDKGVCGALNSECIDGKCICDHSDTAGTKRWSYWGGELCESQLKSTSGETCSDSLGSCTPNFGYPNPSSCKRGNSWWGPGIDSPLDTLPNTCGCTDGGYRVALDNDFEDHAFTGKTLPRCVPIKFDELCLRDNDCQGPAQSGMECVNNKCACTTATHVPDIDGTTCDAALKAGDICESNTPPIVTVVGHCDGTKFLVCGDVCDVKNYQHPTINKHCVCDHSYGGPGSGCTKATEDSTCDRDYQCKSLSRTGVCVEGLCKAGARLITGSLIIMLAALLVSINVIS